MANQYTNNPHIIKVKCDNCGKKLTVKKSLLTRNNHNYCNRPCRDEHRRKMMLEEVKYVKVNLPFIGVHGLMKRWNNCDRATARRRINSYRRFDKEIPFIKRVKIPKVATVVKIKSATTPKPKKEKKQSVIKPVKQEVKKFKTRVHDVSNMRYVQIDSRTWALRPINQVAWAKRLNYTTINGKRLFCKNLKRNERLSTTNATCHPILKTG